MFMSFEIKGPLRLDLLDVVAVEEFSLAGKVGDFQMTDPRGDDVTLRAVKNLAATDANVVFTTIYGDDLPPRVIPANGSYELLIDRVKSTSGNASDLAGVV